MCQNLKANDNVGTHAPTIATYTVPEANLPALLDRIQKLNKRAAKLGFPAIEVTHQHAYFERQYAVDVNFGREVTEYWLKDGEPPPAFWSNPHLKASKTGRVREWFAVTVTGDSPRFNGWHFVATLEPVALDGGACENLLLTVPGAGNVPSELRSRIGECDHCGHHRKRNQTFVVKHEDGTFKMIGRQCIRDFLGHASPHNYAAMAEWLVELEQLCSGAESEGWGFGGGGRVDSFDLETFLGVTAAVVEDIGFVSRTVAAEQERTSTADYVAWILSPSHPLESEKNRRERKEALAKYVPNAEQLEFVANAVAWVRDMTDEQVNDNNYLSNLRVIVRMSHVTRKTTGFAASIISAYAREVGKRLERSRVRLNEWFGEVKKRYDLVLTCEKVTANEGFYGTTGIHKLTDADGRTFTWFASESTEWLRVGSTYEVRATVKKHDDYRGQKQTVLTRVSVVEKETEEGQVDDAVKDADLAVAE